MWLRKTSNILKEFLNPKIFSRNFKVSSLSKVPGTCSEAKMSFPEAPLETASLRNGMKLICECKDSFITTVGFFLPAGSMHEKPEERGASLFMEHLIFKRTRCHTQEEIAQVLDQTGGKLGALAMRDMFLFYGTIPSYDVECIVQLLADVVINGITHDEDISPERIMILRELLEIETDHEKVAMDYLPMTAYQGTELGRSVYPDTCTIENIQANVIESFRKRLFQPKNMTMISTGGTSFEDIQQMANEYFIGAEENGCAIKNKCSEKDSIVPCFRFTGSEIRLRDDDEELGHVAVAVEGPGHANCDDHCTLTVAKEIIGSWDLTHGGGKNNSPYLAQCASGTDMCHMYKSFNIGWTNTSLWGCYFVCERMQLDDMMWMVQNEWMRLCSTITSKEVARAVNQCKTREIVRVNDSVDRFFDIANCLYRRGGYDSFNDRLARYDSVTAEKIREVANKYIYDQCPAVVALGPVENLMDYNRTRSAMYRLRH